jgi:hypothetical protein
MGRLSVILIFLGFSVASTAQVAISMADAQAAGIDVNKLEHSYTPALNPDSAKAAFVGHTKEFVNAYRQMLGDIGAYLGSNNFFWEKQTHFTNRIYFKADGHVDYYLFAFKDKDISATKETQFKNLMNQFIKTYKFPLACKVDFSEASPVTFLQSVDDPTQPKNAGKK